MISAEIVADSISSEDKRLTTFSARYPKFVHGELMTHRVFSRNASSSRAIPVARMIAEVRDEAQRVYPVRWTSEQRGMVGGDDLNIASTNKARAAWGDAALSAVAHAEHMSALGVHKSIVNRILEPFLHINVLITATEYDNFFGLRLAADAQPEIGMLAVAMWEARKASVPRLLLPGEWHLPYVDGDEGGVDTLRRVSVARCARISYRSLVTERRSTIEEDLELCGRLLTSGHLSPAEHQATPDRLMIDPIFGAPRKDSWYNKKQHGNLVGWRQYRKMLPGEALRPLPEGYK